MREIERLNIPLIRQGLHKFKDGFSLADKDERMRKRGKGETGETSYSFIITAFFWGGFGAVGSVNVNRRGCGSQTYKGPSLAELPGG